MNKIRLVFTYELLTTLSRPVYLFLIFAFPITTILITIFNFVIPDNNPISITQIFTPAPDPTPEGFVDQSGLVRSLPYWVNPDALLRYSDIETAQKALESGEIGALYIIPEDYLETGKVTYLRSEFSPSDIVIQNVAFERVLSYNLLSADQNLAELVAGGFHLEVQDLSASQGELPKTQFSLLVVPLLIIMCFVMSIGSAAGLLVESLSAEKTNRILEVLLVSISPLELLTGKLAALGLLGLVQISLWMVGVFLTGEGTQSASILDVYPVTAEFFIMGGVYFLLGYTLYASVFAGIGALTKDGSEVSSITSWLMMPLFLPYLLVQMLITKPDSTFTLILSLFPATSPAAMLIRLLNGNVQPWEHLVAVTMLLLAIALTLRSVARLFKAQVMLAGQPFTAVSYVKILLQS